MHSAVDRLVQAHCIRLLLELVCWRSIVCHARNRKRQNVSITNLLKDARSILTTHQPRRHCNSVRPFEKIIPLMFNPLLLAQSTPGLWRSRSTQSRLFSRSSGMGTLYTRWGSRLSLLFQVLRYLDYNFSSAFPQATAANIFASEGCDVAVVIYSISIRTKSSYSKINCCNICTQHAYLLRLEQTRNNRRIRKPEQNVQQLRKKRYEHNAPIM